MRATKTVIWIEYLLLLVSSSLLAYCLSVVLAAHYFQSQGREKVWHSEAEAAAQPVSPRLRQQSPAATRQVSRGALVGTIEVPRLHLSDIIAEGDGPGVLRVAVGHVRGTALPGQSGNVVLAAHRDTFFRHLGELKQGDIIGISVPGSEYRYRVTFTDVVRPQETWVMRAATGETLTLITCYPFHYIGPAPERFVVRARRVDNAN